MVVATTLSGLTRWNGALTLRPGFPARWVGFSVPEVLTTIFVATDAPPSEVRRFFVTWVSSPGFSVCSVCSAISFLIPTTGAIAAADPASEPESDESESESESEDEEDEEPEPFDSARPATAPAEPPAAAAAPPSPATLPSGVDSVRLEPRSFAFACFEGVLVSESLDSSSDSDPESSEDELEEDEAEGFFTGRGEFLDLDFTLATGATVIFGLVSGSESELESELEEEEALEGFVFIFFFFEVLEADESLESDDEESESEESELEELELELEEEEEEDGEEGDDEDDDKDALSSFHSRIISSSCGPSIFRFSFKMTTSFAAFFKASAALEWDRLVRKACIRV